MTIAMALPGTTEVLSDARDHDRALRVSWHPGHDIFVMSIWRADRCTATFQLVRSDVPDLINCLVKGVTTPQSLWSSDTYAVAPATLFHGRPRFSASRHWISRLVGRSKPR